MMSLGLVASMYLSMFYLFVITSLLVCIKINVQAHVRKKYQSISLQSKKYDKLWKQPVSYSRIL